MKKDKLIQEFENLKIENANSFVGGKHNENFCDREIYAWTADPNGPAGNGQMDPTGRYQQVFDLDPTTNDTIVGDTISNRPRW